MPRLIPIMIQNDQKTIPTVDYSSSGIVSSPASGALGSCLSMAEEVLGIPIAHLTVFASLSGIANRIRGAPSRWLW
jgi:hypothetical protein